MQYSGAECEATLREPYLNAGYHVQNLRQFVCELEQFSQVRKLNIVTHVRSECQLDLLEQLKAEQQRIEIIYHFSSSLHEWELVLGGRKVVVCDRGLDLYTKMRRSMRRTRQCRVLYFEVHGGANAAERGATAMTHAPVTPPTRRQGGRQAPSTPEKPQVKCQWPCGIHEGKEPQEKPPCEQIARVTRALQREAEVKQQQDWSLIFVDREVIYPIIDCLEELVGAYTGAVKIPDWYMLSMSICRV